MLECKFLSELVFHGVYEPVELLGQLITLRVVFWGKCQTVFQNGMIFN